MRSAPALLGHTSPTELIMGGKTRTSKRRTDTGRVPRKRSKKRSSLRRADGRIITIALVIVVTWSLIGFKLFQIQVVQAAEFSEQALDQRLTTHEFAPYRGTIFDRTGHQMALTIQGVTVWANPQVVENPTLTAHLVAGSLGIDEDALAQKLASDKSFVFVKRQLEAEQVEGLRSLDLAGIYFEPEPKRVYPNGPLAAQAVGFVGIDGTGIEGLEYSYDEELSGVAGYLIDERDPYGRPIPQGFQQSVPPIPGADLLTSMDMSIQFMAEQACLETIERTDALGCSIVVLDPKTGEILAMAVLPSFDPGDFNSYDESTWPNSTVRNLYEPGSTQKLVTVAAAIEEKAVAFDTEMVVPYAITVAGREIKDFGDFHEPLRLTVADIVTRSSNVGTIMIGQKLGDAALRDYLHAFGYGQPTGVDFAGEATGVANVDPECGSCTASAAIGYSVSVTPLQMASVYATIANNGTWIQPHVVRYVDHGDGDPLAFVPETREIVSPDTAFIMRSMLQNVVDNGTGKAAAIDDYTVGGKTGTTLKYLPGGGYSEDHIASFIGMAPMSDPRLVIAVVVDRPINGYTGGAAAAPAFGQVMEKALHHLGVEPDA